MFSSLTEYRASPAKQLRVADLFALLPACGASAFVSLDLERTEIVHPGIEALAGDDVAGLQFDDSQFDVVHCAGVLEHIPERLFDTASTAALT